MTATDELRHLLDERGVKWEDASPVPSMKHWKTSFTSFTGEEVTIGAYDEPKWLMGTMVFYTPAQVIAATLGSGTCRYELRDGRFVCSSCGRSTWAFEGKGDPLSPPNFCPRCGAKVVDA